MLLRALQTTTTAGDDRIDALTLVLLVVFIASMAALSFLLHRRDERDPVDATPAVVPPAPEPSRLPLPAPARRFETETRSAETAPVWLEGVRFPTIDASLSDATQVIEGLLTARRDRTLLHGMQFYTPELRERLQRELGVDEAGLEGALATADFQGAVPSLRAVELVSATGTRMSVRAGYANGMSEIYRFVRIEERWLVEGIEREGR